MGNSNSDCGNVHIQLNKVIFYLGENITGTLSLNVVKAGFQHNVLYLKLKGKEDSVKKEGGGKHRRVYKLKETFIQQFFKLHTFNQTTLPIGQMQIPFSIQPFGLNATTIFLQSYDFYVKVNFTVIAYVNSDPQVKVKSKIKYVCPIILQRGFIPIARPIMLENVLPARTFCCISRGACLVQGNLPVSDFFVGQTAKINFAIDNSKCSLTIERIEINLSAIVKVNFRSGIKKETYLFNQKYIPKRISAGQPIMNFNEEIAISAVTNPLNFRTSCVTPKIDFSYFLNVIAILEGCTCCVKKPQVNLPITVITNSYGDAIVIQQPQIPNNWNPQLLEQQTFQFQCQQNVPQNQHFFDPFQYNQVTDNKQQFSNNPFNPDEYQQSKFYQNQNQNINLMNTQNTQMNNDDSFYNQSSNQNQKAYDYPYQQNKPLIPQNPYN